MAGSLTASRPRILINIPILNEIAVIETLLHRIMDVMNGHDYLILFVDDGSTDGTVEYLTRAIGKSHGRVAMISRTKTRGGCQRGAALLFGLKWGLCHGPFDIFVEMDGDLSHSPEEIPAGLEPIAQGRADMVIVSKYLPESGTTGRALSRNLISSICSIASRSVIRWQIHDFSNGFRFFNFAAAQLVPQYKFHYGSPIYLTEVLAIWLANGMRVVEIPGHYEGRNEGSSKVVVFDYIKACIGVIDIGIRYRLIGFRKVDSHQAAVTSPPSARILESRDK